jgi:hypothetical protein
LRPYGQSGPSGPPRREKALPPGDHEAALARFEVDEEFQETVRGRDLGPGMERPIPRVTLARYREEQDREGGTDDERK